MLFLRSWSWSLLFVWCGITIYGNNLRIYRVRYTSLLSLYDGFADAVRICRCRLSGGRWSLSRPVRAARGWRWSEGNGKHLICQQYKIVLFQHSEASMGDLIYEGRCCKTCRYLLPMQVSKKIFGHIQALHGFNCERWLNHMNIKYPPAIFVK